MFKKHIIILVLIIFLRFQLVYSQSITWVDADKNEVASCFEKVSSLFYNAKAYSVNITHSSFENYQTNAPYEKMHGYFKKLNNNYHNYLMDIHTIQNTQFKMVVDSVNKLIIISNPDKSFENSFTMQDYLYGINLCEKIQEYKSFDEKKYKFIFSENNPVTSYEISFYKDGLVKEIILYLNQSSLQENSAFDITQIYPRASVAFSNYSLDPIIIDEKEFSGSNYIFFNEDNKADLQNRFKDFKLMDHRIFNN